MKQVPTNTRLPGRTHTRAVLACVLMAMAVPASRQSQSATLNRVTEWNRNAEDAVIRSGAFQGEGFIYMGYVSAAVYDATVAIEGGYEPYRPGVTAPAGASADAAVVEAAYRTLSYYFPTQAAQLDPLYESSMAGIPDGAEKAAGQAVGSAAAALIITTRMNDGRLTPVATTSPFPRPGFAPGSWRLTPTAYAAAQTPWVRNVTPFFLQRGDQFLPGPPPSLSSSEWVDGFNEVKSYGQDTSHVRTAQQTQIALFWTTNVVRQYNRALRDLVNGNSLSLLESARLAAMLNMIGADAMIAMMNGKYHYLFWRPVTAIDPDSVQPSPGDGGPIPGFDDGNPNTLEEAGWRPLVATPNHPEYPSAHGSITSAVSEVFGAVPGSFPLQSRTPRLRPGRTCR